MVPAHAALSFMTRHLLRRLFAGCSAWSLHAVLSRDAHPIIFTIWNTPRHMQATLQWGTHARAPPTLSRSTLEEKRAISRPRATLPSWATFVSDAFRAVLNLEPRGSTDRFCFLVELS